MIAYLQQLTLHAFIADWLPWILSGFTAIITVLAGNKHRYAWAVGLLNQVLWFIWIVEGHHWGLLGGCLLLTALYLRNHIKWERERLTSIVVNLTPLPTAPAKSRDGLQP